SYYVPRSMVLKMQEISATFDGYKQLKMLENPVKTSYFTILLLITLLIVFFAIWIGNNLSKKITVPILKLAEGTQAVASGNLDYKISVDSKDEVGELVKSFNRMTEDIKAGKAGLESANLTLRNINAKLEERRRYIEIVLGNIPAGVISIDRGGKITSINKVGADMLGVNITSTIERNYKEVLRRDDRDFIRDMIRDMNDLGAETLERQMRVKMKDVSITVLVNLNAMRDESGDYLGMVAVLDDLTHLLKTQRMLAWKEVAKRIAHEIKNPLTPIRLSAQRLRKKYSDRFSEDEKIFDDCTRTIINQVDELKTLVNEFSSFARMATANPAPNDLNEVVSETISFYEPAHKSISFNAELDSELPVVEFDRDQFKRVLINLIENSIDSIKDVDGGVITVRTGLKKDLKIVRIEVADNGCGIPAEDKDHLFEPYFSTKSSGTGLGLAIVSNIISDHNGYIRVKDREGGGTRFLIELPLKAGI
ncbi:MAG: HAMP domain-containing protein, partial [Deltaproteobacteria bacterium]|nr:HAMP domain-containing protein [Deltaproteobacteria bacterium]